MKSEKPDQISGLYRSHEEASELPDSLDRRAFLMRTAMFGKEPALTAREMNAKYKETSEGGLAVSVVLC